MDCILEMQGAISKVCPRMDGILKMQGAISKVCSGMDGQDFIPDKS
jgi:hypothetical protein